MTVHYDMPAEEYHALPAVSASLLWDVANECPAYARYNSPWLNSDYVEPAAREDFENGTIIHLACLEPDKLAEKVEVIDAPDWRTKAARARRELARRDGKIPILAGRERGVDYRTIEAIRKALEESSAAPYLFGPGNSEVSFTWRLLNFECKARCDRVTATTDTTLVDLKSAPSASIRSFQRAIIDQGHHLRAAWYRLGWREQTQSIGRDWPYLFVVVSREPPHLVSTFELSTRALEWGNWLLQRTFRRFQQCYRDNSWPGYTDGRVTRVDMPMWAEHGLADIQAEEEDTSNG